jgi:hypothetical protein
MENGVHGLVCFNQAKSSNNFINAQSSKATKRMLNLLSNCKENLEKQKG